MFLPYRTIRFASIVVFAALCAGLPAGVVTADLEDDFVQKERQLTEQASKVKSLADELKLLDETIVVKETYVKALEAEGIKAKAELAEVNEDLMNMQRERNAAENELAKFVRTDYVSGRVNEYAVIASDKSLSENLSEQTYLANLEDHAFAMVKKLAAAQKQISERQDQARDKYRWLDDLEIKMEKEATVLNQVKASKQNLLTSTQGQEALFKKEFQEAKEQLRAMGLFACSEPRESKVWNVPGYVNQLDTRWVNHKLGFSDTSSIGCYGCGVASMVMVLSRYGIETDPVALNEKLKASRGFVDDLLDWRNVSAATDGKLAMVNNPYPVGKANVDWALIDSQLLAGDPVIVYIDRGPSQVSHYVVLLKKQGGGYLMHDPLRGPYLDFTDYYRKDSVYQYITFRRLR